MKKLIAVFMIAFSSFAFAEIDVLVKDLTVDSIATLSWTAPATRVDGTEILPGEIAGYRVYSGPTADQLNVLVELPPETLSYVNDGIEGSVFYAVTVFNIFGAESDFSVIKEVRWFVPKPAPAAPLLEIR